MRAHTGPIAPPLGTGSAEVYAPTFFPNATRIEDAHVLRVHAGQELFGIDFALVTVETATVAGIVLDATASSATARRHSGSTQRHSDSL